MNVRCCNINMLIVCCCRLKEAQLSVKRITGEKKVETRKINPNSLVRGYAVNTGAH